MNPYLKMELDNMLSTVETFETNCQLAALQDDGVIDKQEKKDLEKIRKLCTRFVGDLKKLS